MFYRVLVHLNQLLFKNQPHHRLLPPVSMSLALPPLARVWISRTPQSFTALGEQLGQLLVEACTDPKVFAPFTDQPKAPAILRFSSGPPQNGDCSPLQFGATMQKHAAPRGARPTERPGLRRADRGHRALPARGAPGMPGWKQLHPAVRRSPWSCRWSCPRRGVLPVVDVSMVKDTKDLGPAFKVEQRSLTPKQ